MTLEEKKERKRLYDIEYCKKNAEKKKEQQSIWREANSEKKKENDKKYYEENSTIIKERISQYRKSNKEKINQYHTNRKANDPLYKLVCNVRSLIKQSFKRKGTQKPTKTELILGCSFETFKQYIESKFESWMTWDNYGNPKDGIIEPNKTWGFDHIVPLSTATTIDEIIKLNHYSNIQPLCSYTNRWVKSNVS